MMGVDLRELVRRNPDRYGNIYLADLAAPFPNQQQEIQMTRIPIHFQGGDISQAIVNGRNVVIIGPSAVSLTRDYYTRIFEYGITDDQIRAIARHAFGAPEVILLDGGVLGSQPQLAFHIDQTVFFPRDGVAVMIDVNSVPADTPPHRELREALRRYRQQLEQAGFRIISIPTSTPHIDNFQAYTNSLFIATPDGRTRILMPSFGDVQLERQIRAVLLRNGFEEVIFIPNTTFRSKGNTHCLTGTLARSETPITTNPTLAGIPRRTEQA
jgi:hypothetical protein